MGMKVYHSLTFVLSPGGGEESCFITPSPLWGEGRGEGGLLLAKNAHYTKRCRGGRELFFS